MSDNDILTRDQAKKRMKVVFIRSNVLFPQQILNFELGKDNEVMRLIEEARVANEDILVITEKNPTVKNPLPEDVYKVGTTAKVTQILRLPNDTARAIVRENDSCHWRHRVRQAWHLFLPGADRVD